MADHIAGRATIYDKAEVMEEHLHSEACTYPPNADPVTLTASGTAWTEGAKVVLIGNTGTLDNAAAVDQGGTPNVVRIPATGHGYSVDMKIKIVGTTNYDGTHTIVAVNDANTFDIEIAFNAETFAGSETTEDVIPLDFDFHFVDVNSISANGDYEINLYSGESGSEVRIGRIPVARNAVQSQEGSQATFTPINLRNTKISASLNSGNAAANTVTIKLVFHTY